MRALYGVVLVFVFTAHTAYAGFDFGPIGNAAFWLGLGLWSAFISWMLYVRRATLGKRIFSFLRTLFAPHKKTQIIVSAPKYRPYVETTHVVDSLEKAADSFLTAAKTGIRHANSATREALSVLEHDRDAALVAVKQQRARIQKKGTSFAERARNIQRMILRKPIPKTPVQAVAQRYVSAPPPVAAVEAPQQSDHALHTRQKVQVLSDAHRALIRARNAQHDLPTGGVYHEVTTSPVQVSTPTSAPTEAPHRSIVDHVETEIAAPIPQKEVSVVSTPKVHHETVHTAQKVMHVQEVKPVGGEEQSKKPELPIQAATKDELVLDTSGPIPRLILTRK
jgi:hypothetical protein